MRKFDELSPVYLGGVHDQPGHLQLRHQPPRLRRRAHLGY